MEPGNETLALTIPGHGPAEFIYGNGKVQGYVFRRDSRLTCPVIVSSEPGRGYGTRCIAALEAAAAAAGVGLRFANVLSPALIGILRKRGYILTVEVNPLRGDQVDVWTPEEHRQAEGGSAAT